MVSVAPAALRQCLALAWCGIIWESSASLAPRAGGVMVLWRTKSAMGAARTVWAQLVA